MQGLADLTICEGDIAQLEVRFSQENVEGTWMKNGLAISATDRIHIVIDKLNYKLLIEDANKDDTGTYSFVVPNQDISTSGKLIVQGKVHKQCLVVIHVLSNMGLFEWINLISISLQLLTF